MLNKFNAIILFVLLLITACGPDYNTDFEPPPPNASLDEVFPAEIVGMKRNLERITLSHPLEGFTATYGNDKITIDAILSPNKETADNYFKEKIVPRFDEMKNHFRGNVNGRWSASGTDEKGRRWFGWVNNGWIFLLSGSDKDNLKKAIDAFKYISK
jgi:hypothetical protein